MLVEQAVGQLATGALDGVGLGVVALPHAERPVGPRAGELDHAERPRELHVHRAPGEREVLERPLGVRAVQAARRHGDLPEQVVLDAHVVAHRRSSGPAAVSRRTPSSGPGRPRPRRAWPSSPSASSSVPKNSMSTTPLGEQTFSLGVVQADARLDVAAVLGEDLLDVHGVLEPVADVDAEDDVCVAHGGPFRFSAWCGRGAGLGAGAARSAEHVASALAHAREHLLGELRAAPGPSPRPSPR